MDDNLCIVRPTKLRDLGIGHARYLKPCFHPKLCRIPDDVAQDIDVLFYGTIGRIPQAKSLAPLLSWEPVAA